MLIKLRKKISAKLVHSGGLNWIEQFWIKLRPIVDELTENTLYVLSMLYFLWRWFKLVCTIWTISEMLCFLQIVETVAIKFVPREVIVWISSGSAQNHFDYRVSHGNPLDQQKSKSVNLPELIYIHIVHFAIRYPVLTETFQVTSFH